MGKVEKRSSLELFGGEKELSKRMQKRICELLAEKPDHIGKLIRQEDPFLVIRVISDNSSEGDHVPTILETYRVFKKLEHTFDLSFSDILGQPVYNNVDVKNYWMQEYDNNPMIMAARLPGSADDNGDAKVVEKRHSLYFNLKVRGELERKLFTDKKETQGDAVHI